MKHPIDRREFLKLAGLGGVVFASSLGAARAAGTMAAAKGGASDDFYFVQLSDSHWGFEGPPNPDAKGTLKKAVAAVNSLSEQPDFIVFTGDLTHTTDDPKVRRQRLTQFKDIVSVIRGRHSIQTGIQIYRNRVNELQDSLTEGNPAFTGVETGNPAADFMVGIAASFVQYSTLAARLRQTPTSLSRSVLSAPLFAAFSCCSFRARTSSLVRM